MHLIKYSLSSKIKGKVRTKKWIAPRVYLYVTSVVSSDGKREAWYINLIAYYSVRWEWLMQKIHLKWGK